MKNSNNYRLLYNDFLSNLSSADSKEIEKIMDKRDLVAQKVFGTCADMMWEIVESIIISSIH